MAREPLTKEQVTHSRLVLNVEKVALTEEQLFQLCSDNRDLRIELTAQKELIIMPPAGLKTGWRNNLLCYYLTDWSLKDGTGFAFDSSTGYRLPNTALRGPDASWIRRERLASFDDKQLEKFGHLCPDFVVELMSPSNTLAELKDKLAEYIANGAQLGWLIDPYEARVYIYRPGQAVEWLDNPITITGDPELPGFVFDVTKIW